MEQKLPILFRLISHSYYPISQEFIQCILKLKQNSKVVRRSKVSELDVSVNISFCFLFFFFFIIVFCLRTLSTINSKSVHHGQNADEEE